MAMSMADDDHHDGDGQAQQEGRDNTDGSDGEARTHAERLLPVLKTDLLREGIGPIPAMGDGPNEETHHRSDNDQKHQHEQDNLSGKNQDTLCGHVHTSLA